MDKHLTPSEIVENNKRIIAENKISNWKEIHAYTLKIRLKNKENN